MRTSRLWLTIVSLTLLAISVSYGDPEKNPDKRLSQKVTNEAHFKPVREILADLTQQTGVTFRAGQNEQDWQVRDRRMNIFAKDLPLSNLMNSIARVMGFKWTKHDSVTPPVYRLIMDRTILLGAEAQRARDEQRYSEMQWKTCKNVLAKAANFDDLSDAEKANLKEEDPQDYLFGITGFGAAYRAFYDEVGPQIEAADAGQRLQFHSSDLSPLAQQKLLSAMEKVVATSDNDSTITPNELQDESENIVLTLENDNSLSEDDLDKRPIFHGFVYLNAGKFHAGQAIIDSENRWLSEDLLVLRQAKIEGRDPGQALNEWMEQHPLSSEANRPEGADAPKLPETGEPIKEHPDDPSLQVRVTYNLGVNNPDLWQAQSTLAKSADMSIVSDSFQSWLPGYVMLNQGELELSSVLDNIAGTFKCNWNKQGQILEFRDRQWFQKRSLQIPDAWIDKWKQDFITDGTLDLDELAEIDALTIPQKTANIWCDDILSAALSIDSQSNVLWFYEKLDQEQRAALFSGKGLDLRSVPEDYFVADLCKLKDFFQNPEAQAVMYGTKTSDKKSYTYQLKVVPSEGLNPFTWKYTTAEYKAPKKGES